MTKKKSNKGSTQPQGGGNKKKQGGKKGQGSGVSGGDAPSGTLPKSKTNDSISRDGAESSSSSTSTPGPKSMSKASLQNLMFSDVKPCCKLNIGCTKVTEPCKDTPKLVAAPTIHYAAPLEPPAAIQANIVSSSEVQDRPQQPPKVKESSEKNAQRDGDTRVSNGPLSSPVDSNTIKIAPAPVVQKQVSRMNVKSSL